MAREQKSQKWAHLSLLRQRQNMKGNDSTDQGKTKQEKTYKNIMQPKKHKKINSTSTRLYTTFVNCAH